MAAASLHRIPAALCALVLLSVLSATYAGEPITQAPFGQADGQQIELYRLTNAHGIEARIMTYGATLVSLKTPDRTGAMQNIILGFDTLTAYLAGVPYFGATVGRYANRIANARFELDGETYQLSRNDGPNSLHGGARGFDKRIWRAAAGSGHCRR